MYTFSMYTQYCRNRTETNTLKNAIKSADYYNTRKRRYNLHYSYEEKFNPMQAGCGASVMAVFHHDGLCFDRIFCNKVYQ